MPKGNHFFLLQIEKSTFDPLFIFSPSKDSRTFTHTHTHRQSQASMQTSGQFVYAHCTHCNASTHLYHLFAYKLDTLNV